jgi:hypothetical protein
MVTWFKCRPNRRVETLTSESAGRETTARVRPAQETTGDGAGEGGEVVSASS